MRMCSAPPSPDWSKACTCCRMMGRRRVTHARRLASSGITRLDLRRGNRRATCARRHTPMNTREHTWEQEHSTQTSGVTILMDSITIWCISLKPATSKDFRTGSSTLTASTANLRRWQKTAEMKSDKGATQYRGHCEQTSAKKPMTNTNAHTWTTRVATHCRARPVW